MAEIDRDWVEALAEQLGITPVMSELLARRGLETTEDAQSFLHDQLDLCHDPELMRDMAGAVEILRSAIAQDQEIFIHGDYDVDGICSTTLLVEGLKSLNARVRYHLPDRFTEGYGVSTEAVRHAIEVGCGVLLTVDCGSSSHQAIEEARAAGMKVIVADHHHVPDPPPCPDAFLNPVLPDCPYPFKALCGTGVAFKLIQALYGRLPEEFLDLLALATIADVVPLRGENRILVRAGLEHLARFQRPGLKALAESAGAVGERLGAWTVAFGFGPRLNAAGRLEHARLGLELLMCPQMDEARQRADRLEVLNQKRRDVERKMRDDIVERLEEQPEKLEFGVVVEAGEDWHQGVIGITASRVVDLYGVPAFVISIEGDYAKGSARAPENVDLYQAMSAVSDVFVKFGGHPRAGGFTVETSRIDELRERISPVIQQIRTGVAPIRVDMTLPLEAATVQLSRELEMLEPIGEGNPRPLFMAKGVSLERPRAVGKHEDHLQLQLVQGNTRKKAIAFRQADDLPLIRNQELFYDVLFHLQEETWDGRAQATLVVEGIVAPDDQVCGILESDDFVFHLLGSERPELWDLRNVRNRRKALEKVLRASDSVSIVAHSEVQAQRLGDSLKRDVYHPERLPQEPTDDLILLSPPAELSWFQRPLVTEALRVHFLFGQKELQIEEARQQRTWLSRPRMVEIWKRLTTLGRRGPLTESSLEEVAQGPLQPETVRCALDVLEELGVASWETVERQRLLKLTKGRGLTLEASTRYRESVERRQRFLHLRELLGGQSLKLGKTVKGVS